jgi:carbohydrate-selective porin OprB
MFLLASVLFPFAPVSRGLAHSLLARSQLTGDWGGMSSRLESNGVKIDAVYTGEAFSTFRAEDPVEANILAAATSLLPSTAKNS